MKTTLRTEARQIRLPIELWEELAAIATERRKSRAELIREQLQNFVKRAEKKGVLRDAAEESHE